MEGRRPDRILPSTSTGLGLDPLGPVLREINPPHDLVRRHIKLRAVPGPNGQTSYVRCYPIEPGYELYRPDLAVSLSAIRPSSPQLPSSASSSTDDIADRPNIMRSRLLRTDSVTELQRYLDLPSNADDETARDDYNYGDDYDDEDDDDFWNDDDNDNVPGGGAGGNTAIATISSTVTATASSAATATTSAAAIVTSSSAASASALPPATVPASVSATAPTTGPATVSVTVPANAPATAPGSTPAAITDGGAETDGRVIYESAEMKILLYVKKVPRQRRECPICFGKFAIMAITLCGHIICDACVNQVVRRGNNCPVCRSALSHAHI